MNVEVRILQCPRCACTDIGPDMKFCPSCARPLTCTTCNTGHQIATFCFVCGHSGGSAGDHDHNFDVRFLNSCIRCHVGHSDDHRFCSNCAFLIPRCYKCNHRVGTAAFCCKCGTKREESATKNVLTTMGNSVVTMGNSLTVTMP